MSEEAIGLPPYEGGPLHNPGMPGRDPLFALGEREQDTGEHAQGGPELVHKPNMTLANICILSDQRVRTLIREEVHRALYPTAEMANPHEHRRIEMTEESGKKWLGVLYAVDRNEE